jgi:hypothetical protein
VRQDACGVNVALEAAQLPCLPSGVQLSHGQATARRMSRTATLKASFNVSAKTGYDANAVMYFHFNHAGYLCGTNGSEAKAAQLVQRDNKP